MYAENILEILCVDYTKWKVKCDNIISFPIYFFDGKIYQWIIVIVWEQGKGILQWSFSVWKGTIYFRASFPLLLLRFCQCSGHGSSPISSKWKISLYYIYIKHTCTRTINLQFFLQDPPVFYQDLVWFRFYSPSTHFRSFRTRSVTLTTLYLGKPPRQFTST